MERGLQLPRLRRANDSGGIMLQKYFLLSLVATATLAQISFAAEPAQIPPPPAAATPPAPATPPTAVPPAPPSGAFFYFCQKSNAYFPTVKTCDEGWVAVPTGPSIQLIQFPEPAPPATEETTRSQPNAVSIEILGRALSYSLDYDRAISPSLTLGIGISSWQSNNWWQDYHSTVTVVPVYANYYFSEKPRRGFISAGVDWISVTEAGYNDNTFSNNGFAAVIGGGYEVHDTSGFLLRLGGYAIAGRSFIISPSAVLGYAF